MSSRRQIIQTTSTTEPVGAALGDEWFEPTSGRLYKRMLSGGTVGWTEIQLGQANVISSAILTLNGNSTNRTSGIQVYSQLYTANVQFVWDEGRAFPNNVDPAWSAGSYPVRASKFVSSSDNGYYVFPTGASYLNSAYFTDNATATSAVQVGTNYVYAYDANGDFNISPTGASYIRGNGNFGIGNSNPSTKLFVTGNIGLDGVSVRDTATLTTAAVTQVVLASASATTYGSMDIIIQATQGTERHITKLSVTTNAANAISTEYSTLITNVSLFTVDTDLNAGNMRVLITPASSTSTTFKASYELITA